MKITLLYFENVQIPYFQVPVSKNQDEQHKWFHSVILYLMDFYNMASKTVTTRHYSLKAI